MGNITKNSFIDPDYEIYLISLPKDFSRRNNINVIPNYTFAVDGSSLDIQKMLRDNLLTFEHHKLTKGEIGCYLSHVELLKKSIGSGKKYIMIIEDDVGPIDLDSVKKAIEEAPKDFEILLLGYNYVENFTYENVNVFYGAYCYVVNIENINIEKINKLFPIEKPYDLILAKKFNTYAVKPKIVNLGTYSNYSNTQNIR